MDQFIFYIMLWMITQLVSTMNLSCNDIVMVIGTIRNLLDYFVDVFINKYRS
jgi:hypothetical protein